MPKTSKPFRFCTEGATCDGRTVSRQDIVDMAETYKRETYTARANIEHIRGVAPTPPFQAYGDVADGLYTAEVELDVGGKKERRLALYGCVDALDNLVALNDASQKIFPSVEINPNFATSGRAYLQGIAFTDSPAALGTEIMKFAAGAGDANPFKSRKIDPGNFFSAVDDGLKLEFTDAVPPAADAATGFFAAATAFFNGLKPGAAAAVQAPAAPTPTPTPPANDNDPKFGALLSGVEQLSAGMQQLGKDIRADLTKLRGDHDALKASVEGTPKPGQATRSLSTGGNAAIGKVDF